MPMLRYDHLVDGRNIVKEGIRVRDEIEKWAPGLSANFSEQNQSYFDSTMSFYHCGLVSVSRLFIDPLWVMTGEQPSTLPEEKIKFHSLNALAHMERRLKRVGIEAFFYLPLLMGIALEMRSDDHRKRILDLLETVEKKGFSMTPTLISDLHLAWSMTSASRE
jgi:hypothetical protein